MLGLLFLKRTDRQGWFRNVVTVFAITLATATLLSAMAWGNAINEGRLRSEFARNLMKTTGEAITSPVDLTTQRNETAITLAYETFGGHQTIQTLGIYQLSDQAPLFPGLVRQPAKNELFVSQALMDLINREPTLKQRYANYDVKVAISEPLLGSTNSLLLVYRIPTERLTTISADSNADFRLITESHPKWDVYRGLPDTRTQMIINTFMAMCGIGVCFPLLILVISATRVGMMQREQRYAALSLIGASRRQINRILLVETLAASGFGVLLGAGLYLIFQHTILVDPKIVSAISSGGFFERDVTVSPKIFVAVVGLIIMIAISVNWWAVRKVKTSPLGVIKDQKRLRRPTMLGLLPLVAAVIGIWRVYQLGSDWFMTSENSQNNMLIFAGLFLLMMVSLLTSGAYLTYCLARVVDRVGQRATVLMATKRMRMLARPIFSSVSGVVLALFVGSFFISSVTSVRETYRQEYSSQSSYVDLKNKESLPETVRYSYYAAYETSADFLKTNVSKLRQQPQTAKLIKDVVYLDYFQADYEKLENAADMIAGDVYSCQQLAELTQLSCPDNLASTARVVVSYKSEDDETMEHVIVPESELPVGETKYSRTAVLVLNNAADNYQMRLLIENQIAEQARQTDYRGNIEFADEEFDPVSQVSDLINLVMMGTGLTIVIGGISLAVATIGGFFERKKSFSNLRLMGVDIQILNRVVLFEAIVPLLLASVVAITAGILTTRYLVAVMSEKFVFAGLGWDYALLVVVSLLAAVGLVLAILPIMKRITQLDANRSE